MQGDGAEMLKKTPHAQECFTPSKNNWANSQIFK